MNKVGLVILMIALISIVSSEKASAYSKRYGEGINQSQPLSVGDTIYEVGAAEFTDVGTMSDFYTYIYTGVENNNIKVEVRVSSQYFDNPKKSTSSILSLPLNQNKQTLLKVKTLKSEQPDEKVLDATEELVITLVDDFSRIKVEKLKK